MQRIATPVACLPGVGLFHKCASMDSRSKHCLPPIIWLLLQARCDESSDGCVASADGRTGLRKSMPRLSRQFIRPRADSMG